jgi:hypothetical protein
MDKKEIIMELDKIIEEFIERSKVFVEFSCYLPGLKDSIDGIKTIRQVYDHEYLAFVKSAKTLVSIKSLLQIGHNEDVFVLIRSILENYITVRYLNENVNDISDYEIIERFIQNKIKVDLGILEVKYPKLIDSKGQIVSQLDKISNLVFGLDRKYFKDFYSFLSKFTHLDFSILDYYIDENKSFSLYKENDIVLVRLYTVFVFTKLFECIVTVEGEDFYDEEEERKCYELVNKSLLLQRKVFGNLIDELNKYPSIKNDQLKDMLKEMNNSLEDSIGSIDKSTLF